jgi:hypothetical protein
MRFEVSTAVTMKNSVFWDVFLRSVRRLLVTASVVPSSQILVTLMKETLSSSETSVLTRAIRRNIPKDTILHFAYSLWNNSNGFLLWTFYPILKCQYMPEANRIVKWISTCRLCVYVGRGGADWERERDNACIIRYDFLLKIMSGRLVFCLWCLLYATSPVQANFKILRLCP